MKHPTQSKGAALALLALAGSASAITPQNGYEIYPSEGNTIAWPTGLGTPGNFRRIVLGEFAGSVMPGALALVGNKAVYLFEPAVHKDVTLIASSGVNDIAALKESAPGLPAGMIIAKTDGLYLASLDLAEGDVSTTSLATGNFANLSLVRSGPINGTGLDDIVGANGSNVYVLLESGSGWASGGSFQTSGTVRDMVVLDWDDDDDGDVAILLDQSVEFRESDGDLIETQLGVASGGFLAHVPPSGSSAERLAWSLALPSPSTTHALVVLSYPSTRTGCGVFAQAPGSLLSAVVSNSARVDLLTSTPVDPEVRIHHHQASGAPYSAGYPDPTYDVGTTVVAGDGPPAFGDFTLDGIPDTIAGRGASHEFFVVPGKPPTLGSLNSEDTWGDAILVMDESVDPWLGITVNLPQSLGGHNHLQAVLWWSTDGEELRARAIQNRAFGSLQAGGSVQVWLPLDDQEDPGLDPEVDVCDPFTEGFAVMVRLVTWDGSSPIVSAASSPLYLAFAQWPTLENMLPPNSPEPEESIPTNCPPPDPPGGSPGISYYPIASLPPKETDVAPSVPAIATIDPPDFEP